MAELALNNKKSAITRQTLFFANFSRYPNMFTQPKDSPKI